jgi:hypothetical protein
MPNSVKLSIQEGCLQTDGQGVTRPDMIADCGRRTSALAGLVGLVCWLAVSAAIPPFLRAGEYAEPSVTRAPESVTGDVFASDYTIEGLPQQDFLLSQNYRNGEVQGVRFAGTRGFIIRPKIKHPERRWIWISPPWTAFKSPTWGDTLARTYVERGLQAGFHVVGLDVGTTCGSPRGAELYQKFYGWLVRHHELHDKVRMIGISNGGLITYAWAFRYPHQVDRILGIYPATDMRSWPGLGKVVGPGSLPPRGLAFPFENVAQLESNLDGLNPIANLDPLAQKGVRLFHVHGDKDDIVPLHPNSTELQARYVGLGGRMKLDILPGESHGGVAFFEHEPAAAFLVDE